MSKLATLIYVSFILAAGTVFFGCRSNHCARVVTELPLGSESVIAVAQSEVQKLNWKRYEIDKCRHNNGLWEIDIWRLPHAPGGMVTVIISSDCKVLRIIHGL